jgi:HTH-type transcriptional regulator, transcriptional repressor of NAD biosynthesis genes
MEDERVYSTGLVIGRFLPPHRGHRLLIEAALEQSRQLDVIVDASPSDPIPAARRAGWLRELHPAARVRVVEGEDVPDHTRAVTQRALSRLGRRPEALFASDAEGGAVAHLMGSVHVAIDPSHWQVPCSEAAVRADPLGSWEYLEPCVRAWYAKRVCVLGAGSTGTTTMVLALAGHYDTAWVPEYGRDYWVERYRRTPNHARLTSEFLHVALEQSRREDELAREANRVLICDNDAFAIGLSHQRHLGRPSPEVEAVAESRRRADLYLLTDANIPYDPDGAVDSEDRRQWTHEALCTQLPRTGRRWVLLTGAHEERLERAVAAVDGLLHGG